MRCPPPRTAGVTLAVLAMLATLLAGIPAATAAGVPAAAADPGPCRGCGGYSDGNQTVYGGSFHVRVKPPAVAPDGGATPGGGGGEVADCAGLMAPTSSPTRTCPSRATTPA